MKKIYPPNRFREKNHSSPFFMRISLMAMLLAFLAPSFIVAQEVYTIREGTSQVDFIGPSPFTIDYRNQRSQYLYTGDLLQNEDAPVGYITSVALKITRVALPTTLQPQNLQIKMGLTMANVLPEDFIPNLPVVYSSIEENITGTGWYTFVLDTPMYWDGSSNVVMEFCRTNTETGDSFELEAYLGLIGEYRTIGLANDLVSANGCTLSGITTVTLPNRRLLPSMQITMTNPCESSAFPGIVSVSTGNDYCGEPFTLSVNNSTIASGLSYQWQSSPVDGAGQNYVNIPGATSPTLTTTQEFATYYRRGIKCDAVDTGMFFSPGFLVAGPGCVCIPSVTTMDAAGITNVTIGQINNSSVSTSSYTDFRNLSTNVQKLGVFPLTVKVTATSAPMYTKAWIDWNRDGVFAASESYELGMVNSGVDVSSGMSAAVSVPINAVLGSTIMRVRTASVADMASLEPCGNTLNGETEDYTISVEEGLGIQNSDLIKNSIVVYGANQTVNIRSTFEEIRSVKIYDISGRLLFTQNELNDKETSLMLPAISSQILIVEVITASGFVLNKKVTLR